MLFNSLDFALFLAAVVGLHRLLPARLRLPLLLAASLVFYGAWDWRFLALILGVVAVDYSAAHGVARAQAASSRSGARVWLGLSLGFDFSVLFVFKYLGFFLDSAAHLLDLAGLEAQPPLLDIVLPIGVSFFTLQSTAHVVDVYRGRARPARSLLHYAGFVTFFPQLLAGPIERSERLLPQLEEPRAVGPGAAWTGLFLLAWGLFKKVGVADNFALYVDSAHAHPQLQGGGSLALATYLFAFQIYCDFSGYSDMAVGMARLLGVDLMRNFRTPYFAASIREFWHRWHVSLSTWFRDYLYLPLGGSRHGRARWLLAVVLVFLLSGLWHGAAWTFVIWGALHALWYLADALLARWRGEARTAVAVPSGARRLLAIFATFHLCCFAWIFFRAPSLAHALMVLERIATAMGRPQASPVVANGLACLVLVLAVELAAELASRRAGDGSSGSMPIDVWFLRRGVPAQLGLMLALLLVLLLFGADTGRNFIYYQF